MSSNTTNPDLPTSPTGAPSGTPTAASDPSSTTDPTSNPTPVPTSSTDLPSSTSSSSDPPPTSSDITPTSSTSIPSSTSQSNTPPPSSSSTTPTPTSSTLDPTSDLSNTTPTPTSESNQSSQSTITQVVTSTQPGATFSSSSTSSSSSNSATATPAIQDGSKAASSSGLGTGGTIAVAVVVPIVAVALLVLAGLFFWRKRKQRKDAEELRRKEVEEYGYNPNNDPTLPPVGGGSDGPFEMREEGSSGYRGWGTTAVASSGRKASTTLSGGQSAGGIGMAYSDGTSPTQGPVSDTRSDNQLVDGRPLSEMEGMGAMGPAAANNRNGDINRGPSNASSQYSAAARSDGSGELHGGGAYYNNNQYESGNPYADTQYGSPPAEMSAQPVIRDVSARRNTRIENPSHFPQQSAGISQNF